MILGCNNFIRKYKYFYSNIQYQRLKNLASKSVVSLYTKKEILQLKNENLFTKLFTPLHYQNKAFLFLC